MGILILTWQLLGAMQEKKHDCTHHLETSLDFISSSLGPCLQLTGKKLRKVLLKAQFKRNQNLRSTGGSVVQNFKCWISTADTFGPSKMFVVAFRVKCMIIHLAIYLLFKQFKADCARQDFHLW